MCVFFVTAIQCKGCMLIRFLCCKSYLSSKSICTSISKVVVDALSKRSDVRLQMEVEISLPFIQLYIFNFHFSPFRLSTLHPSSTPSLSYSPFLSDYHALLPIQAVHCAQTLCVMSSQMAEAFVKNCIHMILFNTLYRDEKTADLNLSLSLAASTSVSVAGTPYSIVSDRLPSVPVGGARGPAGGDQIDSGSSSAEHDCKFLFSWYNL